MNYSRGENDGQEGLDIIEKVISTYPEMEIVPVTAYGEVDLAVEAMKRGARDFITKPWRNEKLLATIENILKLKSAAEEIQKLRSENEVLRNENDQQELIGQSKAFLKMITTIQKVAPTDANVLITGENGTGKELIARSIHTASSRKKETYVKVDLGSLPATLFESEMFGHNKGAFTDAKEDRVGKFELANGGTLFLDEIGNIDLPRQAKLLNALQERNVTRIGSNHKIELDIRVIVATNADLEQLTRNGDFRQDLLYRINTIEIKVPSLRERIEDIPILAQHYLEIFKRKYQKKKLKLSNEAVKSLQSYSWPGNIRELTHVIERAVILSEENVLTPSSLIIKPKDEDESDSLNIQEMEKVLILKSLDKNKGNITKAAKDLGIDRLALYRRLEKYGL